ncbi:MAG TPA: hypothetical protein VJN88_11645 [Ktedonobacterales bacterium]|nr:hypothetical protein [Ktedonobacterales bacterium]
MSVPTSGDGEAGTSGFYRRIELAEVPRVRQELAARGVFPIIGYHGTSRAYAESILASRFRPSMQPGDWLGDGSYFWEEDHRRAKRWADEHHSSETVVLGALIRLDGCMNLLGSRDDWIDTLQGGNRELRRIHRRLKTTMPGKKGEAHGRDREVFNLVARAYAEQRGIAIRSVREVFVHGRGIFPSTAIYDLSHVQIAIRDDTIIEAIWLCTDRCV